MGSLKFLPHESPNSALLSPKFSCATVLNAYLRIKEYEKEMITLRITNATDPVTKNNL